jgi:hypothetical protein
VPERNGKNNVQPLFERGENVVISRGKNWSAAAGALAALLTTGSVAAVSLDAVAGLTASTDSSASTSSASSTRASSAKFTGRNGKVSVNGDLVQARDGVLTVNDVSYGAVTDKSVIQYVVRDGEKMLTVDGVPRKPLAR